MPYRTRVYLTRLSQDHLTELIRLPSKQKQPSPICLALASAAADEMERRCCIQSGVHKILEAQDFRVPSMSGAGWCDSMTFCLGLERSIEDPTYAKFSEEITVATVVEGTDMMTRYETLLQQRGINPDSP